MDRLDAPVRRPVPWRHAGRDLRVEIRRLVIASAGHVLFAAIKQRLPDRGGGLRRGAIVDAARSAGPTPGWPGNPLIPTAENLKFAGPRQGMRRRAIRLLSAGQTAPIFSGPCLSFVRRFVSRSRGLMTMVATVIRFASGFLASAAGNCRHRDRSPQHGRG